MPVKGHWRRAITEYLDGVAPPPVADGQDALFAELEDETKLGPVVIAPAARFEIGKHSPLFDGRRDQGGLF